MIKQKYQSVLDLGTKLNIQNGDVFEENGVLKIKGTAKTPYEKILFGTKLKLLDDKIRPTLKLILKFAMKVCTTVIQ